MLAFLMQTLRIAIPYLFAASGGVVAERAGIVSLTLEGFMLTGAFAAALGSFYSGSAWVGVLCGVVAGLGAGLLHAWASVRFKADQIVVGIALNLLAVGTTRFFLRLAFDSSSNSPRTPGFGTAGGGSALAAFTNPLVWMGLLVVPAVALLVYRTPFGLRLRAAGEKPEAAQSLGVPVARVRWAAVALSGVLAALGGVYLALDQHQFTDEMTAGRGFIALAAVIFGRWNPLRAGLACLLFAAAETLQIRLQVANALPSQFVAMIPYVLTVIALAGVVGRSTPPAALGKAEG
ncbi:MAG: ABC transporter, permease protein 2 (cluster 11, riboflavin/purine nucleoside/unknown) [uncultured Gemmatimonadaceae bacterium]|uniref:Nucleoside ABC transporter, permease protein 2 n=1 Tax=uncultured Gemmatimonadaceae bacterium TaxID=246130 RepID=A0A6J4LJ65_9BACT|nr:MAG: ABC transporter, permease protein 2 (cluster 11, riboflavin/purine nucleoside/unknown) [uncultured Gemmatimonadaceae bacterium]